MTRFINYQTTNKTYHRIVMRQFVLNLVTIVIESKDPIGTQLTPEGGDLIIEAAFFANANTGLATELIIAASGNSDIMRLTGHSTTFVYEHSTVNGRFNAKFLKDISENWTVVVE
ncbi:MAG: hypothetical protein IPI95_13820 [Flavobacteriales bacterium]|nr:hypothetical protein [Flavobacteriales bacterium]